MRCVIYTRVSTDDQAQQFGLPSQLRACREHAQRAGYEIVGEFVDEGVSGATLDRPQMEAVRALIRSRQVNVLLAHDPDRLSRDLSDLLLLSKECDKASVQMEFVTMPAGQTHIARMLFQMKGVISEFERRQLLERTRRGQREMARQGHIVGSPGAFGYRYIGKAQGERGHYIIDEQQAAVVRDAFKWADEGESVRGIVRRLNEAGIQPQRGSRWYMSSVALLLRNEMYVGVAYYNRLKGDGTFRPQAEWIKIAVPPIIDRALFDRMADRLDATRALTVGRPTRRYLLRGLIRCSCGARMCGESTGKYTYYRCTNRACGHGTSGVRMDETVWRAVTALFADPKRMRTLIEKRIGELSCDDGRASAEKLRAQAARLKAKESRAARALMDSDLVDQYEFFKAEMISVREQRRKVESELMDLDAAQQAAGAIDTAEAMARELRQVVPNMYAEERQELLRRFVERISVDGTEVEIRCFFISGKRPVGAGLLNFSPKPVISFVIKEKVA